MEFDAFELCTPELQEKLVPIRSKFKVKSIIRCFYLFFSWDCSTRINNQCYFSINIKMYCMISYYNLNIGDKYKHIMLT